MVRMNFAAQIKTFHVYQKQQQDVSVSFKVIDVVSVSFK